MKDKIEKIVELSKDLIVTVGEDPKREGLLKTPMRAAKAWSFLLKAIPQILTQL